MSANVFGRPIANPVNINLLFSLILTVVPEVAGCFGKAIADQRMAWFCFGRWNRRVYYYWQGYTRSYPLTSRLDIFLPYQTYPSCARKCGRAGGPVVSFFWDQLISALGGCKSSRKALHWAHLRSRMNIASFNAALSTSRHRRTALQSLWLRRKQHEYFIQGTLHLKSPCSFRTISHVQLGPKKGNVDLTSEYPLANFVLIPRSPDTSRSYVGGRREYAFGGNSQGNRISTDWYNEM